MKCENYYRPTNRPTKRQTDRKSYTSNNKKCPILRLIFLRVPEVLMLRARKHPLSLSTPTPPLYFFTSLLPLPFDPHPLLLPHFLIPSSSSSASSSASYSSSQGSRGGCPCSFSSSQGSRGGSPSSFSSSQGRWRVLHWRRRAASSCSASEG